ncbi:DUF6153 family protein [Streptomyces echinatus]|uniref:Uncharacterized protein n=1 Tax=Streptomyces echinatus TaxID=67293 RepID=A0A7W9PQW0_9ACTN|nr:DUF6153 family protein [Streptomyces echinatus]MBB5926121.1 hypothetical protein [Streptomyces echinatus]
MHSPEQRLRPPLRRYRALSVLAVLIGLLGMHALGPGGGAAHAEHARGGHRTVALGAMDDCPGGDGHCGGGLLHHADPSCASGAVYGGPQLPAPGPAPASAAVPSTAPRPCAAPAPDGARAPPSLAELQLLRI